MAKKMAEKSAKGKLASFVEGAKPNKKLSDKSLTPKAKMSKGR